jgi:hypothetical protein
MLQIRRNKQAGFTKKFVRKTGGLKEVNVKRIGILTSGGDAPGMNACIRAVVRTAASSGVEIIGIKRGYTGLITNDLLPLSRNEVSNIIHTGVAGRALGRKQPVSVPGKIEGVSSRTRR